MKNTIRKLPLHGIRIIDLGQAAASPAATRELALLGADVIHVESTKRTDVTRYGSTVDCDVSGQFWNKSGRYNNMNTNKRSLTLDLSKDRGREILKELVKTADIVTENWAPRVKYQLGLHYDEFKKVKEDIIMISASGYGATGPWAKWVAWGMTIDPMSGISNMMGFPDGPPVKTSPPLCDFIAAGYVAFAAVSALEYRRRTGQGQWVELSELETGVRHIGEAMMDYSMNGKVQTRIGNRHPYFSPQGCYRCQGEDNWVAITVTGDEQWFTLCRIMGREDLASNERYSDGLSRLKYQDVLDEAITAWTKSKDHYKVMEELQGVGIAAGAVLNYKELLIDEHTKARKNYPIAEHEAIEGMENLGKRPYPGLPWKYSKSPTVQIKPSPRLGEHNREILMGMLGMSEADLKELEDQGIIGDRPIEAVKGSVVSVYSIEEMTRTGVIRGYDADYKKTLGIE